MHRPPACAWRAGAAQGQRRLLAALVMSGVLVTLGFGFSQNWSVSTLLLFAILLVSGAVALRCLRSTASGQLRWDGEHWHWSGQSDCVVTEMSCVIDLQRLLLLRIGCEQGMRHWLWLESSAMDAGWLALRRAVVAAEANARSANVNSLR